VVKGIIPNISIKEANMMRTIGKSPFDFLEKKRKKKKKTKKNQKNQKN